MSLRCSTIDAEIDRAIERLHAHRSCVIALVNDCGIRWRLERVRIRRGEGADGAPRTIEPWSAAVFGARTLAARAGAGCAGELRYRGHDRAVLEVAFDVPYAGCAIAEIAVGGPPPAPVHRFALRETASGTVVFRLRIPQKGNHPAMTDQSSPGGTVRPQSVVGPIALDKTQSAPVPVHPNSIVGPIALGLERPVSILEASCTGSGVTLGVQTGAGRAHLVVAVQLMQAPAVTVPPGATLFAIARHEGFLMIMLDGASPNAFITLPVSDGTSVTASVTNAAVT